MMEKAQTNQPEKIKAADLMEVVISASRLLTLLTQSEPFRDAEIGIAEWLALSLLIDREGTSNKQLAKSMGVTAQRANQLCTSLTNSGLISVEQAPDDNRRNVLKVTPKGKTLHKSLSDKLQAFLETALKDREKSLTVAASHLRVVARRLQSGSLSKPDGNNEKKASQK